MKRNFAVIVSAGILVFLVGTGCFSRRAGAGEPVIVSTSTPELSSPVATEVISPTAPPESPPASAPTAVGTESAQTLPPDLSGLQIELQPVISGLDRPLGFAHAGDGSSRVFLVEKAGTIRILQDGRLNPTPFLDIMDRVNSQSSERGLLGLAFHPDFSETGFFYVNYTNQQGDTVISRFSAAAGANQADPGSEVILLTVSQPASNHNGGNLVFGPDGYLYIGLGDGGQAGDVFGNGQNGRTMLGAMMRIDADGGTPYGIPSDNPFLGNPDVLDEIWAIGLRNPWRYSFDRQTGDLYVADVGQNMYEEVNIQPASSTGGENYGWPIMEGQHCYPEDAPCSRDGLILPVVEYDHGQGCSITGGYVYRGQQYPVMDGVYFFSDYCTGRIWGLARSADGSWKVAELLQSGLQVTSFGEDEAGELYVLDFSGGTLYQIQASGSSEN